MGSFFRKFLSRINLENFTTVMALVGYLAIYIQAAKIIYLESAYAVSLTGMLIGYASMLCWLAYGLSRGIRPLIISNFFGLIGASIVILSILYYGDEKAPQELKSPHTNVAINLLNLI